MTTDEVLKRKMDQQEKSKVATKIMTFIENQESDAALDILRLVLTQLLPGWNVAIRISGSSERD